jgi:hypothetical protein
MIRDQQLQGKGGWVVCVVTSLLATSLLWLEATAQAYVAEPQHNFRIHQGRLSVDLQEEDVGDVLTAVGQRAGITILGNPRPGARVSTQFTGLSLDEGLRRLLRLASLSYSFVYARDPTGAVVLTAVHVFEEAKGQIPRSQLASEPAREDLPDNASQSFVDALAQISRALPPLPEGVDNDGAARFRTPLENAQHHAPIPGAGDESELARHFRKMLEQTLQSLD